MPASIFRQTHAVNANYPIQADDIAVALTLMAQDFVADITNLKDSPLLRAIRKAPAFSDVVTWEVFLGRGTSKSGLVTDSVMASALELDYRMPAELTIGRFKEFDVFEISNVDARVARAQGKQAVSNLFSLRLSAVLRRLMQHMNNELYNGTPGANSNLVGLETMFSTNSYANITHTLANYVGSTPNEDYFVNWRPLSALVDYSDATITYNDGHGDAGTLVAPTVRTLPTSRIDYFMDDFVLEMSAKGRSFDILVAHPNLVNQYQAEYKDLATFNIANGQQLRAELGNAVPTYRGRPILEDRFCPEDTLYFLDTSTLELLTMPSLTGLQGQFINTSNPNGLNISVGPVNNVTIFNRRYEVALIPQLVCWDTKGVNRLQFQA